MMAAASARSSVSSSRLNRVSDVGFADLQWMTRVQFPPSNKTTTGQLLGQSRLNLTHFSSLTPSPTTASRLHHHPSRQSVADSVSVGLPLGRSKDDLATIGSGGSNCVSDVVNCEYLERQWKHRMRINVSGQMYETRSAVFDARPDTLLGNPALRMPYWDDKRQEYFFDRHRPSFEVIFSHFVGGGRLVRPNDIPFEVFMDEVLFYNMEPEIIAQLKHLEGITDDERLMPEGKLQKALWSLFEYPETSTAAFIIAIISVSLTLVAILMLCIETLPEFADSQQCNPEDDDDGYLIDDGVSRTAASSQQPSSSVDLFFVVETVCTSWFTLELLIRFVVCPSKLLFWKDFKNLIDVASILPFYVDLLLQQGKTECVTAVNAPSSSSPSLSYLRVFRLARVFKLTKHCVGLQVLIETFKASLEGLSMFMLTLSFCVLVYSSALYYAELNVPGSKVNSIPDAFWWAVITMTTVGYGDVYPVGVAGRVVGTACAVSGILTLAIPVPIIAGHFNRFYSSMTGHHHHNQM